MTNKEWLDYLAHNAPDELSAWFDAEHVETEERAAEGDTEPQNADSRERLEADAFAYLQTAYITYPQIIKLLDRQAAITERECRKPNWDYCETCETLAELTAERDKLQEQLRIGWECECRLQAERDELKAEHERIVQELVDANTRQCERTNELTAERDNLAADLAECEAERERYRSKFGKCLDYADAIHALMDDEGMA